MPRLRPIKNEQPAPAIIPPPEELLSKEDVVVDLNEEQPPQEEVKVEEPKEEVVAASDLSVLQKQIEELKAAKEQETARAAREQARVQELERRDQERELKLQERESDAVRLRKDNTINALSAAQAEVSTAERDLEAARNSGDIEREKDAIGRIARWSAHVGALEAQKYADEDEPKKPPPPVTRTRLACQNFASMNTPFISQEQSH